MILALLIGIAGFLYCLRDWRRGLLLCIAVGFLQDPLRKLVPGQPVAFVVLVGVFFVACAIAFLMREGLAGIQPFFRWYPGLRAPLTVFVMLVVLQSVHTMIGTGSPVLAGLGLLSYLSPLVALFLGQRFARTALDAGRWQKVYLFGALSVGASILLSFFGVSSALFQSIGETTVYGHGGRVEMVSGLLRSSETAAWHAATAACLVIAWSVARRKTRAFWVGAATTLGLLLAVILTGRRKTLGEVLLFLVVFGFLLTRTRGGASRLLKISAGLAFGAAMAVVVLTSGGGRSAWDPYLERSYSVFEDAPDRLQSMAFSSLVWVVERNGFLGRGAGTGAQGAQYFGGGTDLVGWSAEGGLGRITAELGVPGLFVVLWLSFAVARRLWRLARALSTVAPGHAIRYSGLFALLPANAVVFLTAHQVFGDPFVLIILGLIASSALAFPQIVLAEREAEVQARAAPRPGTERRAPIAGRAARSAAP